MRAELDVRPGGRFEITFMDADGTEHTCYGVYAEAQRCNKLSFTWTWKSEPGVESLVTLLLTPVNHLTKMVFEHAHVGNASKHNYLVGWQTTFAKLEQALNKNEVP